MRFAVFLVTMLAAYSPLFAQDQETKLVDRLLRPNTELQNEQQTKKFQLGSGVGSKQVTVRSFYLQDRQLAKNFMSPLSFATRSATSQNFSTSTAYTGSRNTIPNATFSTRSSALVRPAYDANKKRESREFTARKFEARGKSQKAISAENHAMTIDEVRELLNKSK